ncbi:hypothetical protein PGC35_14300 [Psychrobacillus sp. PGGUH221]|uniref:hypothetical protein n=1 Tax=Psychrobacillus sp. PGGUH221 TaxID=3020058 RepID=UPI0035C75E3D
MSINNSNKESIFAIFMKDFYQCWEQLLGFKVENIRLEQRHAGKNVDLLGYDSRRRINVFFEMQVTKANKRYLARLKEMMNSGYSEGVVIWVASSFDDALLKDLGEWMKESKKKYIDFYALTINESGIRLLQELNGLYKLDIYNQLDCLNQVDKLLTVQYSNKNLSPSHCGTVEPVNRELDFSRVEDVKKGLLSKLRLEIPYFLNFHYEKKMNQNDRIMTVGGGKAGIYLRISAKDVRYRSFVELFFEKSREDWFEDFKHSEQEIKTNVHPDIVFGDRRIGVYFKTDEDYEVIFSKLAEIIEKMLDYFAPYTFGKEEILVEKQEIVTPMIRQRFVSVETECAEECIVTEDSYRIQLEERSEGFW